MAKGKSSRGSANGSPSSLTTLLALPTTQPTPLVALADPVIFKQLQHGRYYDPAADRRRYRPDKTVAPPHAFVRAATRLHHPVATVKGKIKHRIREALPAGPVAFKIPNLVNICVRRGIRREVLHALRRTNRGSYGGKRHRNFWSNVKC